MGIERAILVNGEAAVSVDEVDRLGIVRDQIVGGKKELVRIKTRKGSFYLTACRGSF